MMKTTVAVLVPLALMASACSDFATEPDRFPAALELAPDTALINEGETVTFDLTVLDQNGDAYGALPGWAVPFWTVDEAARLEVSEAGVGRALGAGEVRATAALAGLETQAVVRVNPLSLRVDLDFAYISQSVQRRGGGVPLVAGRDGLLRVYLRGGGPNFFRPSVRATLYQGATAVHTATLTAAAAGVPEDVDEGDRSLSYEAQIPGTVLQPGVGLVVEADPGGVVPAASGSTLRIPAAGQLALDIRQVRPFRIRMVPVNPTVGLPSTTTAANAGDRLRMTEDIYPFGEFDVDVRAPYVTDADLSSEDGWYQLIQEIYALRLDDGSPRYYYGGFRRPSGTNILGLGFVGYPVAIGEERLEGTIAHEVGHNLDLPHAPCGSPSGVDPNYPYAVASIGRYGYDRSRDVIHSPEDTYDLMSYCDPVWISDYNYERVLAHRDTSSHDAAFDGGTRPGAAPAEPVLIVQGGVHDGALRLAPALESTAPAVLPQRAGGRYTLEGLDAAGAVLFSLSVTPRALDHGGSSLFAVAIPMATARPDRLAVLRLSGPEGVVERGRAGAAPPPSGPRLSLEDGPGLRAGRPAVTWDAGLYPMAVVRDRATGMIVAMSRTGRLTLPDDPSRLDVALSDGVRTHRVEVER